MKDQVLVPYARTYLVSLMLNDAPQPGEAGAALKIRMARNEYEPTAFGVYANGKDLQEVTFAVSDLKGPGGEKLGCQLDLRTAEYAVVSGGDRRGDALPRYQLVPQRLWPMFPVDIEKDQSHWFWVTVRTLGEQSKPGIYKGTVEIRARGAKGRLPMEVEVLPVTLLTVQQAKLELGGCSGLIPAQDLQFLGWNNHTGMDIWFGGSQPQMGVKDGQVRFDWTYMDDWMASAVRSGMTHMMWFLGGNPYGFPDTLNCERDLYRAGGANGQERNQLPPRVSRQDQREPGESHPRGP